MPQTIAALWPHDRTNKAAPINLIGAWFFVLIFPNEKVHEKAKKASKTERKFVLTHRVMRALASRIYIFHFIGKSIELCVWACVSDRAIERARARARARDESNRIQLWAIIITAMRYVDVFLSFWHARLPSTPTSSHRIIYTYTSMDTKYLYAH